MNAYEVKKDVVYVAGPYRGANAYEVELNIREAEAATFELAKAGIVAFCPHTMFRHFDGTLTDEFWLLASSELMLRCDYLLLLTGWRKSEGCKAEKELWVKQSGDGEIYYGVEDLIDWLAPQPTPPLKRAL